MRKGRYRKKIDETHFVSNVVTNPAETSKSKSSLGPKKKVTRSSTVNSRPRRSAGNYSNLNSFVALDEDSRNDSVVTNGVKSSKQNNDDNIQCLTNISLETAGKNETIHGFNNEHHQSKWIHELNDRNHKRKNSAPTRIIPKAHESLNNNEENKAFPQPLDLFRTPTEPSNPWDLNCPVDAKESVSSSLKHFDASTSSHLVTNFGSPCLINDENIQPSEQFEASDSERARYELVKDYLSRFALVQALTKQMMLRDAIIPTAAPAMASILETRRSLLENTSQQLYTSNYSGFMTEAQPDTQTLLQTAQAQVLFNSHMKHYIKPITSEVTIEQVPSEAEIQKQKILASLAYLQPQPPMPQPCSSLPSVLSGLHQLTFSASLQSTLPNPMPSVLASALQAAAPQIALQNSLIGFSTTPTTTLQSALSSSFQVSGQPAFAPRSLTTHCYNSIQMVPMSEFSLSIADPQDSHNLNYLLMTRREPQLSESEALNSTTGPLDLSDRDDFEDCVPQDLSMKKKPTTEMPMTTNEAIIQSLEKKEEKEVVEPYLSSKEEEDQILNNPNNVKMMEHENLKADPTELKSIETMKSRSRGRPRKQSAITSSSLSEKPECDYSMVTLEDKTCANAIESLTSLVKRRGRPSQPKPENSTKLTPPFKNELEEGVQHVMERRVGRPRKVEIRPDYQQATVKTLSQKIITAEEYEFKDDEEFEVIEPMKKRSPIKKDYNISVSTSKSPDVVTNILNATSVSPFEEMSFASVESKGKVEAETNEIKKKPSTKAELKQMPSLKEVSIVANETKVMYNPSPKSMVAHPNSSCARETATPSKQDLNSKIVPKKPRGRPRKLKPEDDINNPENLTKTLKSPDSKKGKNVLQTHNLKEDPFDKLVSSQSPTTSFSESLTSVLNIEVVDQPQASLTNGSDVNGQRRRRSSFANSFYSLMPCRKELRRTAARISMEKASERDVFKNAFFDDSDLSQDSFEETPLVSNKTQNNSTTNDLFDQLFNSEPLKSRPSKAKNIKVESKNTEYKKIKTKAFESEAQSRNETPKLIQELENGLKPRNIPNGSIGKSTKSNNQTRKRPRKAESASSNQDDIDLYQAGLSLSEISRITGIPEELLEFDRPKRSRRSSLAVEIEANGIIYPLEVRLFAIDRIRNGVSQVQVAKDLDCPVSTVASWWCKRELIRSALGASSEGENLDSTSQVNNDSTNLSIPATSSQKSKNRRGRPPKKIEPNQQPIKDDDGSTTENLCSAGSSSFAGNILTEVTRDICVRDPTTVRESCQPTISPPLVLGVGGESEDTDDEDHSPDSTTEIKNKILKNCFASMAARNG